MAIVAILRTVQFVSVRSHFRSGVARWRLGHSPLVLTEASQPCRWRGVLNQRRSWYRGRGEGKTWTALRDGGEVWLERGTGSVLFDQRTAVDSGQTKTCPFSQPIQSPVLRDNTICLRRGTVPLYGASAATGPLSVLSLCQRLDSPAVSPRSVVRAYYSLLLLLLLVNTPRCTPVRINSINSPRGAGPSCPWADPSERTSSLLLPPPCVLPASQRKHYQRHPRPQPQPRPGPQSERAARMSSHLSSIS